ncbi:MAG: hypothetical protein AB1896_16790, partial [Thermodesulfobacteriota bacterium]
MPDGAKLVLVLARGALGDVLLSLPFLSVLPTWFGAEALTLVGNPPTLELLLRLPFVAGIRDQNQADWAGLYLDPPRVSPRLADFILGHQAGVVLARRTDDPAAAGLRALGLDPVLTAPSAPPEGRRVHVIDYLFERTGLKPPSGPIPLDPNEDDRRAASRFLADRRLAPYSYVALHPGSGGGKKNWPFAHWLTLGRLIEKRHQARPLYILGPAEESL